MFRITGTALGWFTSYLTRRTQRVVIGGEQSDVVTLRYGVPQGSVLGPLLYCMYTTPLSREVQQQDIEHLVYADDSQLYNMFRAVPEEIERSVSSMSNCLDLVRRWMSENMLKLNDEKTEVITFSSRFKPCEGVTIRMGDVSIPSTPSVRDLGVLLDQHMTREDHVRQVCKSAMFHLCSIANIRRFLTTDAAKSLMHSLVTSRLDYCNSVLVGLPKALLQKMQRVQNTAARVVTRTHKYDHITPVLKVLHWLPINRRVEYKILLYTYKIQEINII